MSRNEVTGLIIKEMINFQCSTWPTGTLSQVRPVDRGDNETPHVPLQVRFSKPNHGIPTISDVLHTL